MGACSTTTSSSAVPITHATAGRTVLDGHGEFAGLTAILYRDEHLEDEDPDRDGAGVVLPGLDSQRISVLVLHLTSSTGLLHPESP